MTDADDNVELELNIDTAIFVSLRMRHRESYA